METDLNVGGIVFHAEPEAREIMNRYLWWIFSSFKGYRQPGAMESRMAEFLLTKLENGRVIITAEDVNDLIRTLEPRHSPHWPEYFDTLTQ